LNRGCFEAVLMKNTPRTLGVNFVPIFEERKKNSANFEHYDLRDDNELDPNSEVVGIQVNYKILQLIFLIKLLFSINPPIQHMPCFLAVLTSKNIKEHQRTLEVKHISSSVST
jgi:hypothetical protein